MSIWRRGDRSRGDDEPTHAPPTLADECAAYLSGRYAELWTGPPGALRAWARLNEVAHAPLEQLVAVSVGAPSDGPATWSDVRALLAQMLVQAADHDPERARRLQFEMLQPLESRLGLVADFVTPRRLIEVVEASLIGFERRDSRS